MRRIKNLNITVFSIPIQKTPFTTIDLESRRLFKEAIQKGAIIIVPAGNYGPLPDTMNPISTITNVIVAGAAHNDGSNLCEFSSRGIPGVKFSGPHVVCPGVNIIGRTHSGIDRFIEEKKRKMHLFTRERYEEQVRTKVTDEFWEIVKDRYVISTGTSQAVEYLVNCVLWIIDFRRKRGFLSDTKSIRSIILDMAVPIGDNKHHEIGAGFINYQIGTDYLAEIDKGNISTKMKRFWEGRYENNDVYNSQTILRWLDNVKDPNQMDFTDEREH